MSAPAWSVLLVHSVSWAIRVERILGRGSIACRLVPVPRHLSSDCGVCVRIETRDVPTALAMVHEDGVELESVQQL